MKKQFFIFFCFVFCGLFNASAFGECSCDALKKWTPVNGEIDDFLKCGSINCGRGYFSPIRVALAASEAAEANYNGNPEAVKAILQKNSDAAKGLESEYPRRSAIQMVIDNCCKKGNNKTSEIVDLLIQNDPDAKNLVTVASMGNQETPNSIWNKKSTMLDYVKYTMKYVDGCKNAEQCKKIETILVNAGAKTYAELQNGSASAAVTTVVVSTPNTSVVTTHEAAPVTTDEQTVQNTKHFHGDMLRFFYKETNLKGEEKQESDEAFAKWEQSCLKEGIEAGTHVKKIEIKEDPDHKRRYIELIEEEKNKNTDDDSKTYTDAKLDFLKNFEGTVWGCRVAECEPGYKEADTVVLKPFCEEDESTSTTLVADKQTNQQYTKQPENSNTDAQDKNFVADVDKFIAAFKTTVSKKIYEKNTTE